MRQYKHPREEKPTIELDMALVAARKEIGPVDKACQTTRYSYANINDVIDAIEDALLKHDVSFFSKRIQRHGKCFLKTILKHAPTGQIRQEVRPYIQDNNPDSKLTELQAQGSGETYLRRYALINLLGLRAEDLDNDGDNKPIVVQRKPIETQKREDDPNFVTTDMLESKLNEMGEAGEEVRTKILEQYNQKEIRFLKQEIKQQLWSRIKD